MGPAADQAGPVEGGRLSTRQVSTTDSTVRPHASNGENARTTFWPAGVPGLPGPSPEGVSLPAAKGGPRLGNGSAQRASRAPAVPGARLRSCTGLRVDQGPIDTAHGEVISSRPLRSFERWEVGAMHNVSPQDEFL